MKTQAGLWIDHREAVIVVLSETGEVTTRIPSAVEKQLRRSGEPSHGSFEAQQAPADDSHERVYSGHLARYYDEIVACLRDAGPILIFGPGEAKGELKKRFENDKNGPRTVAMETVDKMIEPQIVAKVRQHFQNDANPVGHRLDGSPPAPHLGPHLSNSKPVPAEPEAVPTGSLAQRVSTRGS